MRVVAGFNVRRVAEPHLQHGQQEAHQELLLPPVRCQRSSPTVRCRSGCLLPNWDGGWYQHWQTSSKVHRRRSFPCQPPRGRLHHGQKKVSGGFTYNRSKAGKCFHYNLVRLSVRKAGRGENFLRVYLPMFCPRTGPGAHHQAVGGGQVQTVQRW